MPSRCQFPLRRWFSILFWLSLLLGFDLALRSAPGGPHFLLSGALYVTAGGLVGSIFGRPWRMAISVLIIGLAIALLKGSK